MSSLRICWQGVNLSDRKANFGHGLCVYSRDSRKGLAVFVDGFHWLHGGDKTVVRFDPQVVPADQEQFAAFKAALEARLRAGDISSSELVPGYWCIANA